MSRRMSRMSSSRHSYAGSMHERRMSKYRVSDDDLMKCVPASLHGSLC